MKQSIEKGVYGNLSPLEIRMKQRQNTEKLMKGALGDLSQDEIEARRHETIDQLHGKKGNVIEMHSKQEEKEERFVDLYRKFQGEIKDVDDMLNEYHGISNGELKKLKGNEILNFADGIIAEIQTRMRKLTDMYEKSDLDMLRQSVEKKIRYLPRTEKRAA